MSDETLAEDDEFDVGQRAHQLALQVTSGVLGTVDEKGYPYTSVVEVVFDGARGFWLLLSDLAAHTRHIKRDGRVSLCLQAPVEPDSTPLSGARACYLGQIDESDDEPGSIADRYLEHHPQAAQYIGFSDFHFYQLAIERVRLVAGFGQMGWVSGEELLEVG